MTSSSTSSGEIVMSSIQGEDVTSLVSPTLSPVKEVPATVESVAAEPFAPVVLPSNRRRLPNWGRTPIVEHQLTYPSSSRQKLPIRRPRGRYAPQGRVASYRHDLVERTPPPAPAADQPDPPPPTTNPCPPPDQLSMCFICREISKSNAFVKCRACQEWVVHSFCIPDTIGRRKRFWLCDVCVRGCTLPSEDCIAIPDPPPPQAPANHLPDMDVQTKCYICHDTSKSNAFVKCAWCATWVVHTFCIPDIIPRRRRFWVCDDCVVMPNA